MKKKIIVLIVSIFLLLPIVVNADMIQPKHYFNDNVSVGEVFEDNIVFYEPTTLNKFEIDYDSSFLSIDKENIKIMYLGKNILQMGYGSIEIESNKVLITVSELPNIQLKIDEDLGIVGGNFYIEMQYKVLKAGSTSIKTPQEGSFYGSIVKITINEKVSDETDCISIGEYEDKFEDTKEKIEEAKEEYKEKVDSTISKVEKKIEETKNDKAKDLILLISLGCNALLTILLIILIIVLICKRKKNTIVEEKIS